MKPQEIVAKLTAQIADFTAKQQAALAAAEAENVTEGEKAKFLAEFDRLQKDKEAAQASLRRAETLVREEEDAARAAEQRRQQQAATPDRAPIVQQPHVPANLRPTGQFTRDQIPARSLAHGRLQAFHGADADLRAYQTGLWVAAAMYGNSHAARLLADNFGIAPEATLSTTNNQFGGYFVPQVMDTAVLELQELYGVVRRRADIVPMSSETWKGPRWITNMTAYWVSQGNSPTQSEPGWDMIELVAKDLAAFGKMSRQLNEDAIIDLGDKWTMAAAVAFSYAEDNAAFNGDGTSTYGGCTGLLTKLGLSGNSASLYTATGHTTLGALTIADFYGVIGKVPAYPQLNPCWFCHKEVYANCMAPLQITAGGGVTVEMIETGAGMGGNGSRKPKFLGYDVEFTQVMPKAASVTTGVTGIIFGDLMLSTKVGDRRQRTIRAGEINDDMIKQLITMFAASRVDIVNHTITDPKDSSKAGPVVGLKLG